MEEVDKEISEMKLFVCSGKTRDLLSRDSNILLRIVAAT